MAAQNGSGHGGSPAAMTLTFAPEFVEAIAERVADLLDKRTTPGTQSPWLDVEQAADYLAADKQRIYDLTHAGTLQPARDGRRLLFRREWLDDYLEGRA